MNIVEKVLEAYPDLDTKEFHPIDGRIMFQDDGDGVVYIAKWEYDKPIPKGLKLGKD